MEDSTLVEAKSEYVVQYNCADTHISHWFLIYVDVIEMFPYFTVIMIRRNSSVSV